MRQAIEKFIIQSGYYLKKILNFNTITLKK
jgi:hypothetical protein